MLVFRNETKGIVSGIIRKSNKSDIIDINNILKDVFGADLTDKNCCYREIVEHSIKDRFYYGTIGDCIRTCPYHDKTMPSECTCWEDMYIRKAK